jgi:DNA mismatch repair protein MutS2
MKEVGKEERRILAELRREGETWLAEARQELERSVQEIRERGADRGSIVAGRERLESLTAELTARERAPEAPQEPLRDWRVGDRVRLVATGQTAEILEASGGDRLRVSVRGLSLVLPLSEFSPLPGGGGGAASATPQALDGVSYAAEEMESYRLDLRGLTVDEACDRLDEFLDGAVLAGCEQVEIIHGKGTGALREAVHRVLKRDRRVASQRLADQNRGGSGATFVRLAGEGGASGGRS